MYRHSGVTYARVMGFSKTGDAYNHRQDATFTPKARLVYHARHYKARAVAFEAIFDGREVARDSNGIHAAFEPITPLLPPRRSPAVLDPPCKGKADGMQHRDTGG